MHGILQCPEVLSEIFSHLVSKNGLQSKLPQRMPVTKTMGSSCTPLSTDRELDSFPESLKSHKRVYLDRRACLAAGMTCKAFLEPALNIIWRDMWDLGPILRLLPDLKRMPKKEDPNRLDNRYEEVHQPLYVDYVLSVQHLEKIKCYSRRVRTFTFYIETWYQSPFWDFEPSLLSSLLSLLGQTGQHLFPHLRVLSIIPKSSTRFRFPPYMSLLLSPTLRTASFPFLSPRSKDQVYANAFWTFVHDLALLCPQALQNLNASFTLPPAVVAAITKFIGLENLVVYSGAQTCNLMTLHHFSKLPHLKFLSLDVRSLKMPEPPLQHHQYPSFVTLKSFQLHADLDSSLTLISLVDLPVLEQLALKMDLSQNPGMPPAINQWEHLFVQVATQLRLLRTFVLQGECAVLALPWRCFGPLLGLQHLLDIRICMPKVECLSMADFTQIAEAWPLLEYLDIETANIQSNPLDCGVLKIISSCLPCLRVLNLNINLKNSSHHESPGSLTPHPSLWYLSGISDDAAATTIIQNRMVPTRLPDQPNGLLTLSRTLKMVSRIACLLDALFPNLQVVPSGNLQLSGSDDMLECVKSHLITLQQARKREILKVSSVYGYYNNC